VQLPATIDSVRINASGRGSSLVQVIPTGSWKRLPLITASFRSVGSIEYNTHPDWCNGHLSGEPGLAICRLYLEGWLVQGPMPFLLPATSVVARPSFFILHVTPEVTDVTGPYISSTVPLEHDNSMKRTSCLVSWCTTTMSIWQPFSRTTWVSRHQKGKPFWILQEQEMMGWQWHQLDHANHLHLTPDSQHLTTQFLHAGCPSCRPTNSVKALKAYCRLLCDNITARLHHTW